MTASESFLLSKVSQKTLSRAILSKSKANEIFGDGGQVIIGFSLKFILIHDLFRYSMSSAGHPKLIKAQ